MRSMKIQKTDTVIIGGGAAGLFAAGVLAKGGVKTLILEPNKLLGKKLRITGKGRCNLTNNCDTRQFLESVPRNGKFLMSCLNGFSPADAMAHFESLGLPLKTERGNRVFPESDSAHDAAKALEGFAIKNGAKWLRGRALSVKTDETAGAVCSVVTDVGEIFCSRVLLCTGGMGYPGTGSTGEGYGIAASLGHTIKEPCPSLVPLVCDDAYCAEMQGFSLKNVKLSLRNEKGGLVYEELGEMIFTHFGISGPLVLSASCHMTGKDMSAYRLSIDLKPALSEKQLDERILRDFAKYTNREFKNALSDLAASSMVPVLVGLSGIPEDLKVNSITKQQRQALVDLFKNFPVHIREKRPIDEAIITSGGVSVKEINPKTMESKLISGLYFSGEIIDVDAYTGGFNLQIAWSTAYAAAKAILLS